MNKSLSMLENHPHIWRAREQSQQEERFSLGFDQLDEALNGGISTSGVIRIRTLTGIGELSLFKHVISKQRTHKMIAFVNPPGDIQAPWLATFGIDVKQVLIVKPSTEKESLWATEQCLKSTACHCVILWSNGVNTKESRRLQVAATHNDALCLLFTRPNRNSMHNSAALQTLPISLDLCLNYRQHALEVSVLKQRHGWPKDNIAIHNDWTPNNRAIKWAVEHNKVKRHVLHSVS
ncbi:translesion DNA synthesis-associated protein ImuA [Alteromonas sp.]|uniref:translesion DNA synthesis-associated protein ImuA n=1 Tax=Alteromonas sp. TaxID=232 RepID=UPI000B705D8E|nr:translesion DNA synthesis-associated protein ImuA [Alteromonas sp.]MAI39399.1 recombinase RecA [Alteromonas sp.]OUX83882.1 MAG: recombinase RecA [Alteromonas sp. TMED35]